VENCVKLQPRCITRYEIIRENAKEVNSTKFMQEIMRFTADFSTRVKLLSLKQRVEPILYITSHLFDSFMVYLRMLSIAQNI
jgi:hypothetical protein